MADTRDNRNPRLKNSPYCFLFVESPEIFDRTATSTNNQHIQIRPLIGQSDVVSNLSCSPIPLHLGRIKDNLHSRKATADRRDNISDDRSAGTGYDADFLRKLWQGLLEFVLKKTFFSKFFLELFKLDSQSSDTIRLCLFDDNRIGTARLIELYPANDIDFHAFFQLKAQLLVDTRPNRDLNDGLFIFQ